MSFRNICRMPYMRWEKLYWICLRSTVLRLPQRKVVSARHKLLQVEFLCLLAEVAHFAWVAGRRAGFDHVGESRGRCRHQTLFRPFFCVKTRHDRLEFVLQPTEVEKNNKAIEIKDNKVYIISTFDSY